MQPITSHWRIILLVCLAPAAALGQIRQVDPKAWHDLFTFTDTTNVYLLRDGDAAVAINLGDAEVLDHLSEIGVKHLDWVIFTDHHREQCQGAGRLDRAFTHVAAPEAEQAFFERPTHFRRMTVRLSDPNTIHGASYLRPPIERIVIDRPLKAGDAFRWRKWTLSCLSTPGASPGAMTYLLNAAGKRLAFSGDLMLDGAVMHTWYDTEWDYGFAAGIDALRKSVAALADAKADRLLPSHGPVIDKPAEQLTRYAEKLAGFQKLYIRGYGVGDPSIAYQDKVSTPTPIKDLWQVSPHLFKFKRANFWPNFNLILADSGHGFVIDCGLLDPNFLDDTLEQMKQRYGLKAIDAMVVTHMHGDHFLQADHLRRRWGTAVWGLENMVDKMEHPERYDYAAPIQAYGNGAEPIHIDRAIAPGTAVDWEGYHFKIDWMPGQTEFALCLSGQIDGRLVAFTGDNIFGDPDDPMQTGHEAMVAHNSAILEEGYITGSEFLSRLKPDLLVGGHSFVMNHPAAFIERYRRWSYQMRDAFQSLSADPDYRYGFDPFWVRAYPYRTSLHAGDTATVSLTIRNFRDKPQHHRLELRTPPGITVSPKVIEGDLLASSRASFPVTVMIPPDAAEGTRIIAIDTTLDGERYGERFDFLVGVATGADQSKAVRDYRR